MKRVGRNGGAPELTVAESWYFNSDARMSKMQRHRGAGRDQTKDQAYAYDPNGNRETDERGGYVYNARDQLTKWTRSQGTHAGRSVDYTLDGEGNVLTKTDHLATGDDQTVFTYIAGRLTKTLRTAGGVSKTTRYDYTLNGVDQHIVTKIDDESDGLTPTTFTYDEFDRLTAGRGPGQLDDVRYCYDGWDRRDRRIVGGTCENGAGTVFDYSYVGTSEELSRERDSGKARFYDYDSNHERLGFATHPDSAAATYRSYSKNADGSVAELEDDAGAVATSERYEYDPYGNLENEASLNGEGKANPFRFEGFYYDSTHSTYDMKARTYRPDVGRFLGQDRFEDSLGDLALQVDPLTNNRYAFAGGNPVNNIEFDGHDPPGSYGQNVKGDPLDKPSTRTSKPRSAYPIKPRRELGSPTEGAHSGSRTPALSKADRARSIAFAHAWNTAKIACGNHCTDKELGERTVELYEQFHGGPDDTSGLELGGSRNNPEAFQKTVQLAWLAFSARFGGGRQAGDDIVRLGDDVAERAAGVTARRAKGFWVQRAAGGVGDSAAKGGVYVLRDPLTGVVVRTGRAKDLAGRAGAHGRHKDTKDLVFQTVFRTDSRAAQRGLEEHAHLKFGKPVLDKIPPLSAKHKLAPVYRRAATRFLKQHGLK